MAIPPTKMNLNASSMKSGDDNVCSLTLEYIKQAPIRRNIGLTPLLEKSVKVLLSKVGHFVYPAFGQCELRSNLAERI